MPLCLEPAIGDWVQVQLRYRKAGTASVSVVSGTIIEEDHRVWGYRQLKLDNGWWFSPQSDLVLSHKHPQKDG